MASFQAKIGWKTQQKRENKNFRFVLFRPYRTRNRKFQNNSKIPLWHHLKTKQVGKGREREKIIIVSPFRSNSTSNRKFQKKRKKNQKIKKCHCDFISSQNKLEKADKEIK